MRSAAVVCVAMLLCAGTLPAAMTLDEGLRLSVFDGKAEMSEAQGLDVDVGRERAEHLSLWQVSMRDQTGATRWLELVLTSEDEYEGVPGYFGGFQPADLSQGRYEQGWRIPLPLAAMWDGAHGAAIALEPHERVSYIWHTAEAGATSRMDLHIRIVVEPGARKDLTFVGMSLTGKWGYREALQRWYELAPEFYDLRTDVDPRVNLCPTQYAAWWGEAPHWSEVCRRNHGGWEWCYAPFKRTGDIYGRRELWDFEPPAPITRRNLEYLRLDDFDAFHQRRKELFAAGERGGVAMLFYVPAMIWCEEALANEHYPDALTVDPTRRSRIARWVTGWDTDVRVLPWNTSYGEQAKLDLRDTAAELDLTGYAYDTASGTARHPGPAAQKFASRAWDDEVGEFVREGIAITEIISYTQTLRHSSGRRLSVVPNLGFAWYTVDQVADAGMKEASPWHVERAYNDAIRYAMGHKPVCWWEGYGLHELIRYEEMTAEQVAEAYIGMSDFVISESLKWGYLPTVAFTQGIMSAVERLPMLLDCVHAGWEPVPAATVEGASWVTRYDDGLQTRLAVGNESLDSARPLVTVDNEWLGGGTHIFSYHDGSPLTNTFAPGATTVSGIEQAPRMVAVLRCRARVTPPLASGNATATLTDTLAQQTLKLDFGQTVPGGSAIEVPVPEGYDVEAVNAEGAKTPAPVADGVLRVEVHGHGLTELQVILRSRRWLSAREELLGFPFAREGAAPASIVVTPDAGDDGLLAAERLVEYFRCYHALALDQPREVALPVVRAITDLAGPAIVLDPTGGVIAGLRATDEPWRVAVGGQELIVAARDGAALPGAVDALLRVLDTKYRYPGYHVGLVHNVRSGLAGRWIDSDGSVHGTPPEA